MVLEQAAVSEQLAVEKQLPVLDHFHDRDRRDRFRDAGDTKAVIGLCRRNPKILLLDEATSALDNRSQAEITRNIDQLDITRIVIAHRLSTIRNADLIYVLEEGQVTQSGTFDELTSQEGFFAEMLKRQKL